MRDVAIVSFSQSSAAFEHERNEVEILLPVVQDAIAQSNLKRSEIEFTCSGSSDFLQGQPFAFVMALDAVPCSSLIFTAFPISTFWPFTPGPFTPLLCVMPHSATTYSA